MISGLIAIKPIRSELEVANLVELAEADKHSVFHATHALYKDNELVGYFSIGAPGVIVCPAWLSTKEVPARESFHLINTVENIISGGGGKVCCFPVPKNSPFYSEMKSMGYSNGGDYTFFFKNL